MHKPLFLATVGSVAAVGALLTASAMPAGAATSVRAETMARDCTGNPCSDSTIVTFSVTTSGTLSMTVPASTVALGTSAAPGGTAGGLLGTVSVADNRDIDSASWTVSVADTDFITGTGTGNSLIPAAAASYTVGALAVVNGTAVVASTGAIPLSTTAVPVVSETLYNGINDASWDPTIGIVVPSTAVAGTYTGTITHSLT